MVCGLFWIIKKHIKVNLQKKTTEHECDLKNEVKVCFYYLWKKVSHEKRLNIFQSQVLRVWSWHNKWAKMLSETYIADYWRLARVTEKQRGELYAKSRRVYEHVAMRNLKFLDKLNSGSHRRVHVLGVTGIQRCWAQTSSSNLWPRKVSSVTFNFRALWKIQAWNGSTTRA